MVGAGIEWDEAQARIGDEELGGRHPAFGLPFEALRKLTASADVGLSLDKGVHGNYEMSLPNKLFDFMHARCHGRHGEKEVRRLSVGTDWEKWWNTQPHRRSRRRSTGPGAPRAEWGASLSKASESFHWGVDEPQIERTLETCLKAHLAGSQTK